MVWNSDFIAQTRQFPLFSPKIYALDPLALHIESLIFVAEHPVTLQDLQETLAQTFEQTIPEDEILTALEQLQMRYRLGDFAFEIVEVAGGYQFLTKGAFFNTVGAWLRITNKRKLSKSALETLALIAYKQPVTKTEVELIRGVNCDYAIQKLLEKELVEIIGRGEGPGRPLLYSTAPKFLHYFGLKNMQDLPQPKDFKQAESEIGSIPDIEEMVADGNEEE